MNEPREIASRGGTRAAPGEPIDRGFARAATAMAPIMIDDDSDDDLPLAARPRPASAAKKPSRDSSSSEEPEWMKTFKSPVQKIVDDLSESDDDDAAFHAAMTGRSPGGKFEMGSTPAKVVKSPPAGDAKEEDDDDDGDVEIVEDDDALRGTEISDPGGPSEPSGTVAGPRFAKPSGPAPSGDPSLRAFTCFTTRSSGSSPLRQPATKRRVASRMRPSTAAGGAASTRNRQLRPITSALS